MIVVDHFLDRRPVPDQYNCFDFAREVRIAYDGLDLIHIFPWLGNRFGRRQLRKNELRKVYRVPAPKNGSFCVYQRPRTQPHIGIWWNGRVLHLPESGAIWEPQANITRRYPYVSYFL